MLVESPSTLPPSTPAALAYDHPDAPKQYGISLSEETMTLVPEIQHHRQRTNQPITLVSTAEDAIQCHYRLVNEGVIKK